MQITNIFNYIIQLHSIKKWKSTTRVSKQEEVAVAKIRKLGWKMQLGSSRSRRFFFFYWPIAISRCWLNSARSRATRSVVKRCWKNVSLLRKITMDERASERANTNTSVFSACWPWPRREVELCKIETWLSGAFGKGQTRLSAWLSVAINQATIYRRAGVA